ncbi:hypothetical protein L873DRAFT_1787569 [Choiromyces venosus 120613-1]|uniref:Uncharacterized protein n=1 Tax=Choiromyces venosus 120613-1 TaxID=1336337 RepID=A0A3N4K9C8_9PEZI|nr:hypothetical protein L873DRAFT_1787569 [Choiromyces venosus 120613-1]
MQKEALSTSYSEYGAVPLLAPWKQAPAEAVSGTSGDAGSISAINDGSSIGSVGGTLKDDFKADAIINNSRIGSSIIFKDDSINGTVDNDGRISFGNDGIIITINNNSVLAAVPVVFVMAVVLAMVPAVLTCLTVRAGTDEAAIARRNAVDLIFRVKDAEQRRVTEDETWRPENQVLDAGNIRKSNNKVVEWLWKRNL